MNDQTKIRSPKRRKLVKVGQTQKSKESVQPLSKKNSKNLINSYHIHFLKSRFSFLFINLKINCEAKNELSLAISCLVWARPRYLCQLKSIATSRVNKVDKKMGKPMIYFTMWHGFRFDYIHQKWRRKLWRLLFWEHIWKRISECQVFPRQISETFHGICLPILHLPPY